MPKACRPNLVLSSRPSLQSSISKSRGFCYSTATARGARMPSGHCPELSQQTPLLRAIYCNAWWFGPQPMLPLLQIRILTCTIFKTSNFKLHHTMPSCCGAHFLTTPHTHRNGPGRRATRDCIARSRLPERKDASDLCSFVALRGCTPRRGLAFLHPCVPTHRNDSIAT